MLVFLGSCGGGFVGGADLKVVGQNISISSQEESG